MSRHSDASRTNATPSDQARWSAIWLIYLREMRDQLRDRRTLFTIAVLPIMLYPLVGMLLLQIAQFSRQHPTAVCLVGTEHLVDGPPLLEGESFATDLTEDSDAIEMMAYRWDELTGNSGSKNASQRNASDLDEMVREKAKRWVSEGAFDLVVLFPPDFKQTSLDQNLIGSANQETATPHSQIALYFNAGRDQSVVARGRVASILTAWRGEWIKERLSGVGIDPEVLLPFDWADQDMSPKQTRETAFWSKLLPFIMLVWAMTGAFYPAIDLVAGEKERGTLETLLCSPALRCEIVWGKLGAVATFSMLTALLNAGSMLMTSSLAFKHINIAGTSQAFGAPPLVPMLWLFVALIPLSCLFSALALAVAAMARSSKEGQYYLMPLMMVTLPLVMLPMLPGSTLNIGTSLIPVTGMFLLVRALVEGQYTTALFYLPMVATVTGVCLWAAARWARHQFENESVLFGGGEQWELGMWVRHLWRDRQQAATPAQAYACGAFILVTLFFARLSVAITPTDFAGIAKMIMLPQVLIVFPPLLMATMFTTSIRESLRIRMTHWTVLPLAVLFGVTLHPTYVMLSKFINHLYPVSAEAAEAMKPFAEQIGSASWTSVVLLMAVLPAFCEELAFRGFIFGGLVRERGKLRAVAITALMFGISHGVLQQSIAASLMGIVLGWITLRTGSILPCVLIHVTNNSLSVSLDRIASSGWEGAQMFVTQTELGPSYQPFWTLISMGVATTCLLYFGTMTPAIDESDAEIIADHQDYVDPTKSLIAANGV
ncbi:ABC transporter permease subunit/CPBP intramembrane protease [Rhodopirellula sp. MGV]|uniref:ABC transporter permease subunit/CPBP intramembrane protease n=1 Tax=Rhodopirellula sp. MGV TaxID=2023130 RepID=UPI000B978EE5|nr:ABC transporter permease subunit/CPBP intramembrane protease [Rhodopirellula sp. MGV]OYP29883.1 CPBP family intramembrane metalloprotease domain-containing protein [Rhodopirellula sp. MGV]PNY33765.1 CPBP family intramembrane metalloprotease [Rhodopirellula baltica]